MLISRESHKRQLQEAAAESREESLSIEPTLIFLQGDGSSDRGFSTAHELLFGLQRIPDRIKNRFYFQSR
jgi:hypothetical protein